MEGLLLVFLPPALLLPVAALTAPSSAAEVVAGLSPGLSLTLQSECEPAAHSLPPAKPPADDAVAEAPLSAGAGWTALDLRMAEDTAPDLGVGFGLDRRAALAEATSTSEANEEEAPPAALDSPPPPTEPGAALEAWLDPRLCVDRLPRLLLLIVDTASSTALSTFRSNHASVVLGGSPGGRAARGRRRVWAVASSEAVKRGGAEAGGACGGT